MEDSIGRVKTKTDEILKLSTENITAHNQVLGEIPKLFVELQKKSLNREILNKNK